MSTALLFTKLAELLSNGFTTCLGSLYFCYATQSFSLETNPMDSYYHRVGQLSTLTSRVHAFDNYRGCQAQKVDLRGQRLF